MHVFEQFLSAIAPHCCLSCGLEGTPLCAPCGASLPYPPKCCYKCGKTAQQGLCKVCRRQSGLQSITIRTLYQDIAMQAVYRLKFERCQAMAGVLARSMAASCPVGVITHVPTANRRVRQRGYDQAELVAKTLAKAANYPYCQLLYRQGSQRQLGKSRTVRQQQLRNAFRLGAKKITPSTPIILIDDVLTTGSTFEAAAETLSQAGYRSIHTYVFAWKR